MPDGQHAKSRMAPAVSPGWLQPGVKKRLAASHGIYLDDIIRHKIKKLQNTESEETIMYLKTYCIYKMIWETCGEDQETFENAVVTEIAPNVFHITYKTYDPYEGMDFKVRITIDDRQTVAPYKVVCQYDVFDSKYGDDGTFEIEL